MGRFESPFQIATLFVGAVFASAFVIFLLRWEAMKRYGAEEHKVELSVSSLEKSHFSSGSVNEMSTLLRRKKRSTDEIDTGGGWPSFQSIMQKVVSHNHTKMDTLPAASKKVEVSHQGRHSSQLSEELLTSALNHRHKIRHIMEKISRLRKDDQVVSAILDKFCQIPKDVGPILTHLIDLVHELEENKKNGNISTTAKTHTSNSNGNETSSTVKLEATTEKPLANITTMANQSTVGLNVNEEHPYSHHLPPPMVLVSDSLKDHHTQEKKEGATNDHLHLSNYIDRDVVCKSQGETLIIVAITTFVNLLFIGVILLCRGCICHDFYKGGGGEDRRGLVINQHETEDETPYHLCCQDCLDPVITRSTQQQKLVNQELMQRLNNCPQSA